ARQVSRLRCRYHGWTYDLAGRLIGTPEFDGVADFERADHGLRPISVATWGKWVWMHLHPDPPSLADQLAPLPEQAHVLQLDSLRFVERREYELACNWKVFVDNYLDGGYHVNTVHPGLAGVLNYAQYRTNVFRTTSVQISPLRPAQPHELDTVQSVRGGTHAYYWWVYPNFMINVYAGVMDTNQVLPLGPDRCRVIFEFYFAATEGSEAEKFMADSMAVAHDVQLEDVSVCEEVQRGLASQSYCTGRFSVRREAAGYQFHRLLGAALCDS
ncbi:MAG: SRPBCC family protein, partial [Pirellulaceae bacterium]